MIHYVSSDDVKNYTQVSMLSPTH